MVPSHSNSMIMIWYAIFVGSLIYADHVSHVTDRHVTHRQNNNLTNTLPPTSILPNKRIWFDECIRVLVLMSALVLVLVLQSRHYQILLLI